MRVILNANLINDQDRKDAARILRFCGVPRKHVGHYLVQRPDGVPRERYTAPSVVAGTVFDVPDFWADTTGDHLVSRHILLVERDEKVPADLVDFCDSVWREAGESEFEQLKGPVDGHVLRWRGRYTQTGVELIALERQRQIEFKGFTSERDDGYVNSELACAGAAYCVPPDQREGEKAVDFLDGLWPWEIEWLKYSPDDRIWELTRAGALIAAEIDRLQRAAARKAAAT